MNKFRKFKNKKILITGHNGFKGSWLTIWLNLLGAKVVGISLKNNEKYNHFNLVKIKLMLKVIFLTYVKKKIRKCSYQRKARLYFSPSCSIHCLQINIKSQIQLGN